MRKLTNKQIKQLYTSPADVYEYLRLRTLNIK